MCQLMEEQVRQGLCVSAIVHADTLNSTQGHYHWNECQIFEVKSYGQLVFVPVAPSFVVRLKKVLVSLEPDIVHIHMPNPSAFWLLLIQPLLPKKSKIIIHWHSDVLGAQPTRMVRLLYPVYQIFENALLRKAHRVIATSRPYLNSSVPLKKHLYKSEAIPLGIKIDNFAGESGAAIGSCATQINLLMIGRLTYYKGHLLVLKALAELKKMNRLFRLNVIGDGDLSSILKDECAHLGLDAEVSWLGRVDEPEKCQRLSEADLLLLPSLERTEAFGVVLLEAANYKTAALVSDVQGSGMSYVVDAGKTGFVINNNSVDALVKQLSSSMLDKSLLKNMGAKAKTRLHNHFDIEKVCSSITNVYEDVLNA